MQQITTGTGEDILCRMWGILNPDPGRVWNIRIQDAAKIAASDLCRFHNDKGVDTMQKVRLLKQTILYVSFKLRCMLRGRSFNFMESSTHFALKGIELTVGWQKDTSPSLTNVARRCLSQQGPRDLRRWVFIARSDAYHFQFQLAVNN